MKIFQSWQLAVIACAFVTASAQADSSVSSASSAGSASSGSVSDSLSSSSNSSGGNQRKVADGNYHIIDIAAMPGHADRTRLTLQGEQPDQQVVLDLPHSTFAAQHLGRGDRMYAQNRVYGIEFGRSDQRQPFYLVLADAWYGELASRPVSL
ncbi:hypothetical protein ACFFKC_13145 [Pseudoduganella danionis]|uniref:Uncharacterized protein n=1 Tax=Pseudoduganella danionis TaxID=1890295 RepID=A0ABW9SMK2_9BURK|nr:hypothetical protein [Pseudoduganella danionis]MTW32839.1 hypothetical protein [Pseudoduganella danionis]